MHEKNDLNVALTAKLTKRSTCIAANAEWPKVLAITAAEVSDETPLPAKQKLPNFAAKQSAQRRTHSVGQSTKDKGSLPLTMENDDDRKR